MVVAEVSYIWLERGADAPKYKKDKSGYSVFKLTLRRLPAQTAFERIPVIPSSASLNESNHSASSDATSTLQE